MSKWQMVKFNDVLSIENGKNQKAVENIDGIYPIYGSGGIMSYANDYLCPEFTTIIGRKGSINNPIYVEEKFWNVDTAFGLVANIAKLLPKYLFYFCVSYNFERHNKAVTIPSLTKSDLLEIKIPLPPLEEQEKIAKNLDLASELVKLYKTKLSELDKLTQSVFYDMFGDPVENKYDFEVVAFNDCIQYMGDIGSNGANAVISKNLNMKDEQDYAIMVRFLNFTANDFEKNIKYIDEYSYDFFCKSKLYGGELVFCKIGSAGVNYLMPHLNKPASLGLNQILTRVKSNINILYLYQYINTNYGKHLINGCINGAVTKSITKTALKKIPIILPPLQLQQKFADIVTKIEEQKTEVNKALKDAEMLYSSLMQEYFE